jgi:uncharacterized protein DUF6883
MRELHGRDAQEDINTGTDSGADAAGRHTGGSRRPDRAIVQNAETRTAFALAYRERVAIEYAARDQGDAVPPGDEGRRSLVATDTEGDRASRPAEHGAGSRDADHGGDQAQRKGKAGRATRDGALSPSTRDLPDARDVLPNMRMAELDGRKLSDYSLNPGHPGNNGKADGWRALGYDVDSPEGRRDAARELRGLICDELLARGKVAESRDTAYGPSHRVVSDLTGPNGRRANLVTCWLVEDCAGLSVPRLTTAWVQPHRVKETER